MKESAPRDRFALWVDGVGGYLVCLRDSVMVGRFEAGATVDIAIQGDISRRHALFRRKQERYWLEPCMSESRNSSSFTEVHVDGRSIARPHLLREGEEIQLGTSVRLRFRQPHPLSATARLEKVSTHRWGSFDGALLMSESCVLGPQWHNHVVCRDWSHDLVIGRQAEGLFCRATMEFEVDGSRREGRSSLSFQSRVAGNDFCLALEPV